MNNIVFFIVCFLLSYFCMSVILSALYSIERKYYIAFMKLNNNQEITCGRTVYYSIKKIDMDSILKLERELNNDNETEGLMVTDIYLFYKRLNTKKFIENLKMCYFIKNKKKDNIKQKNIRNNKPKLFIGDAE